MERRIAAILAADMTGFSRLIELDESGTLARQKQHRLDLIDPTIARHHGRIVKLTGDGLIAEFGSVVEAVQAAVLVQSEMEPREANIASDRRIRYRIAVHLGDVVIDEGDVYGDGVNVAARLEALADPGGIVVSGAVYDMLKNQVDVGYRSLGEKRLKNIATPVRVFEVTKAGTRRGMRQTTRRPLLFISAASLIAVLGSSGWWWVTRPDIIPARPENFAFSIPEKPSIAVAPFVNLAGSEELDRLTIGLSASVITTLSTSPDMIVISQASLEDMVDMRPGQIAERYGVRYVLDGTVQSDGARLRISARLSDALKGQALWSEKWDRAPENVFAIQDEISDAILEELQVRLTIGEQARSWREDVGSPENMAALVQGREAFQRFTPEDHEIVSRLWLGIADRDPSLPFGWGLRGWLHWHKVMVGISTDPVADLEKAKELEQKAIDAGLFGNTHVAYAAAANILGQRDLALEYAKEGLQYAPGEADVVQIAGFVYSLNGRLNEGIALMERGMRLEPDYPAWLAGAIVHALLRAKRLKDARDLSEDMLAKDLRDANAQFTAMISLAVVSVWENKIDEARKHMKDLLAHRPAVTITEMRKETRYFQYSRSPEEDPTFATRYADALRVAGMPEGD